MWATKLIAGVVGIIASIIVIQHPLWVSAVVPTLLTITVGALAILIGVASLIHFYRGSGWGDALLGVVCVLLGVSLLFNPFRGTTLLVILGIVVIAAGAVAILLAFRIKQR